MNIAAPMRAPSIGIWPEWLAMRSTRPVGSVVGAEHLGAEVVAMEEGRGRERLLGPRGSRPKGSTPAAPSASGTRFIRALNSSPSTDVIQSSTADAAPEAAPRRSGTNDRRKELARTRGRADA